MAAIDKIYVQGWTNYYKFRDWVEAQPELEDKYGKKVRLIDYLCTDWKNEKDWAWEDGADPELQTHPVMNNPYFIDAYIIRNCPLEFVQNELQVNYGYWSQERIKDFYDQIKEWDGDGECPYWAKLEDFKFNEDGTITLNGLEKSDYEEILDGELYMSPRADYDYIPGRHFRTVKTPRSNGFWNTNKPLRGWWMVDVVLPDWIKKGEYDSVWYHTYKNKTIGTWDFHGDFVSKYDWCSNCAHCKNITALKRWIRKWKLPVGTRIIAQGRYVGETWEFVVTI